MNTANQEWRDGLKTNLTRGDATVEFTKANGTVRFMRCTLRKDVIPEYQEKGSKKTPPSGDVLVVWDLEKNEWRSFRYDRIKTVKFGT